MQNKQKLLIFDFFIVFALLVFLVLWQLFFSSVSHYIISVVIIIAFLILCFASFESKKISAEETAVIACLVALAVAGRCAFFAFPQIKPMCAVVIISAFCLGSANGAIIGALSAFVSNFFFGQGAWTPFQMLALSLVGIIAGAFSRSSKLKSSRILQAIMGFVLAFLVYGFIVDSSTVLTVSSFNDWTSAVAIYSSGIIFNLIHGVTTAVFCALLLNPCAKKIERIRLKYGLFGNKR